MKWGYRWEGPCSINKIQPELFGIEHNQAMEPLVSSKAGQRVVPGVRRTYVRYVQGSWPRRPDIQAGGIARPPLLFPQRTTPADHPLELPRARKLKNKKWRRRGRKGYQVLSFLLHDYVYLLPD